MVIISYGSIFIIGRRRQMEDAISVESKFASVQSEKLRFYQSHLNWYLLIGEERGDSAKT